MNTQAANPSVLLMGLLLIVLILLTIFGIVYLYINAKSKERLALIEKGMDPNLARSDFWAQIGVIGAGAALGLILGDKIPGGYGPLPAVILAGACSIAYNIITKNRARRNKG